MRVCMTVLIALPFYLQKKKSLDNTIISDHFRMKLYDFEHMG